MSVTRKGHLHELVGGRSEVRMDRIFELVPDLAERDVYVSGPESFVHQVVTTDAARGSRRTRFHFEVYSL